MTGLVKSRIIRNWKLPYVAGKLASIHAAMEMRKDILKEGGGSAAATTRTLRGSTKSTEQTLSTFQSVAKAIKKAMKKKEKDDEAAVSKGSRKGYIHWQTNGQKIQDRIKFDIKKLDPLPCPVCNNVSTMDTDKLEDVRAVNAARHREYLAAKKDYDRGKTNINPRHGQDDDVWCACYCCKFTCNLDQNGGNCPECSKPDADHLEWDQTGLPVACHCPLCNSGCKVWFASSK